MRKAEIIVNALSFLTCEKEAICLEDLEEDSLEKDWLNSSNLIEYIGTDKTQEELIALFKETNESSAIKEEVLSYLTDLPW